MNGLGDLIRKLDMLGSAAPAALDRAVKDMAFSVQSQAQKNCPIETGDLQASANTIVTNTPGGVTAEVAFNATTPDGTASYALEQHERLDFRHPNPPNNPPRGAKYLERAMNEVEGQFNARVAEGVDRFIRERLS